MASGRKRGAPRSSPARRLISSFRCVRRRHTHTQASSLTSLPISFHHTANGVYLEPGAEWQQRGALSLHSYGAIGTQQGTTHKSHSVANYIRVRVCCRCAALREVDSRWPLHHSGGGREQRYSPSHFITTALGHFLMCARGVLCVNRLPPRIFRRGCAVCWAGHLEPTRDHVDLCCPGIQWCAVNNL